MKKTFIVTPKYQAAVLYAAENGLVDWRFVSEYKDIVGIGIGSTVIFLGPDVVTDDPIIREHIKNLECRVFFIHNYPSLGDKFWVVLREDDHKLCRHRTHGLAIDEAKRLTIKEGKKFFVLETMRAIEPGEVKVTLL